MGALLDEADSKGIKIDSTQMKIKLEQYQYVTEMPPTIFIYEN